MERSIHLIAGNGDASRAILGPAPLIVRRVFEVPGEATVVDKMIFRAAQC